MARRVVWTKQAQADLGFIADYISRDSPRYAAVLVRGVRDAARSLQNFSERGRIVPEFDDARLRELIIQSYRLMYLVAPETVSIIAFVHGARDLKTLWKRGLRARVEDIT